MTNRGFVDLSDLERILPALRWEYDGDNGVFRGVLWTPNHGRYSLLDVAVSVANHHVRAVNYQLDNVGVKVYLTSWGDKGARLLVDTTAGPTESMLRSTMKVAQAELNKLSAALDCVCIA